jgi:hypothetical protein
MTSRIIPVALAVALCIVPAIAAQAPPAGNWRLSAAGNVVSLESGGLAAKGERFAVPVTVCGTIAADLVVTAESGLVKLEVNDQTKDGGSIQLRASASRATLTATPSNVLTLDGDARVTFDVGGKRSQVTAERVTLDLTAGRVQIDVGPPPVVEHWPSFQR